MTSTPSKRERISAIYHNAGHPGGLSGPSKLFKALQNIGDTDITLQDVQEFLETEESYSLHKPVNRRFKRNKVIVAGIGAQYDMDLADFSSVSKSNDNFKYLLVVIDVFSKKVWVECLKSKTATAMVAALGALFKVADPPARARSDNGGEFVSKEVSKFFKKQGILHFTTDNEPKANFSERMIKNLRSKIARYTTWKQSFRYIDVLPDIVRAYNNTFHSSIQMAPNQVTKENQRAVWWLLYAPSFRRVRTSRRQQHRQHQQQQLKIYKFNIGDYVRLSLLKRTFMREYDEKWSGEVFKIASRSRRDGINIYRVQDYYDDPVRGRFYEQELQGVRVTPDTMWKISKIIKSRQRKGHEREHLVSWLHWPKRFNSWVKSSELADY